MKALQLLLLCIITSVTFCQNYVRDNFELAPNEILAVANWSKGDKVTYEVEKSNKRIDGSSPERTMDMVIGMHVSFEVLEASESGFEIKYSQDSIWIIAVMGDSSFFDESDSTFQSNMIEKRQQIPIVFTTNEFGEIMTFKNIDEYRESLIAKESAQFSSAGLEEDDPLHQMMLNMMTDEILIAQFMREFGFLFMYHGYIFELDEKTSFPFDYPMPFGKNNTIELQGESVIKSNRGGDGFLFVEKSFITEKGRQQYFKMLPDFFKQMGQSVDIPMQEEIDATIKQFRKTAEVDILNEMILDHDMNTGWPVFASSEQIAYFKLSENMETDKHTMLVFKKIDKE